ncbi:MAG: flagellin [Burkholderiaceae bacterium]
MSSIEISSGSYLASRIGSLVPVASETNASEQTQTSSGPVSDLSLSFDGKGYLLLTDTIDEWSSMVSMVQISELDLETLVGFLSEIRSGYESLSSLTEGTEAFENQKRAIASIESEMSGFLGQRTILTPDVELAYSETGSFQEKWFQSLDLSLVDSTLEGSSLGVIEVDMGQVLLNAHNPATCPLCAAAQPNDTSNSASMDAALVSDDGLVAYDGAATNTSNVTGGTTSTASGVSYIETLRMGPIWDLSAGETLSYSYYDGSVPYTGYPEGGRDPPSAGLASLIPTHETNLDLAYAAWDTALEFDFEKISETGTTVGELRNAYTTVAPSGVAAYAYNPGSGVVNGDVWFVSSVSTNSDFTPGGYGFMTALHEIGHAIGLSHPFDNSSDTGATLSAADDIMRNTFMSYTSTDRNFYLYDTGSGVGMKGLYASTPMVYDVATVEYLYGTVTDANTGDTTYSWASTPQIIETIVDSGGTDTIDASNQTTKSIIDLTPGAYSSIGLWTQAEQVTYFSAQTGVSEAALNSYIATQNATVSAPSGVKLYTGEDNVGIAFSATIENAIGGQGDDQITGNTADNQLTGNQGNDTIAGGAGNDTAVYNGNFADYSITNVGGTLTVIDNVGTDGTDTLTTVEFLRFADLTYNVATGATAASGAGGSSSGGGGSNGAIGWRPGHGMQAGSVRTAKDATKLIEMVDLAMEYVNSQRAAMGAVMNRLERRTDVLSITKTNIESAQSLIADTNYAIETAIVAKQMILARAGQEMIKVSQMNSQEVLALLR